MAERIIAIGDIHGCSTALEGVLKAISPREGDLFVPLGDYVDRGPNSKRVIDLLIELSKTHQVEPLFGNHEQMMMAVIEGNPPNDWLRYGGVDTLDSYGFSGNLDVIPSDHLDFLRNCHDFFITEKHFFVHANYVHNVPLEELDEATIRWRSLAEEMPGPHQSGKTAVVGHTPDKTGEILDMGYLKCIDTYCYGGQWLTALDVLSGAIWQANEEGEVREK